MEDKVILFCTCCFADETGGSWGYGIERVQGREYSTTHCYNCGSGGSGVLLAEHYIKSIRNQASWVGKRYYPNDEDKDIQRELKLLRSMVEVFPGRTVVLSSLDKVNDKNVYEVVQKTKVGSISTHVYANTYEEAVEKAKVVLPYYSETELL